MYLSTYHNIDKEVKDVFESTKRFWRAGFNPTPMQMMEMGPHRQTNKNKHPILICIQLHTTSNSSHSCYFSVAVIN